MYNVPLQWTAKRAMVDHIWIAAALTAEVNHMCVPTHFSTQTPTAWNAFYAATYTQREPFLCYKNCTVSGLQVTYILSYMEGLYYIFV